MKISKLYIAILLLIFLASCSKNNTGAIVNNASNENITEVDPNMILSNTDNLINAPEEPEDIKDYTKEESRETAKKEVKKESTKASENKESTKASENKESADNSKKETATKPKNQEEKLKTKKNTSNNSDDKVYTYALYDCTNALDEDVEIALIFEGAEIEESPFNRDAFNGLATFAEEKDISFGYYRVSDSTGKHYEGAIETAIANHAKVIVALGDGFKIPVGKFQMSYPEVIFILVDSVPTDVNGNELQSSNTLSIVFNEELAGFMAGYAVVAERYTSFGFIGGEPYESVKDYGYGFAQGLNYASKRLNIKTNLKYTYSNTFDESDEVMDLARMWYKNGCQIIFSCGGAISNSIVAPANSSGWFVIGVDSDQSTDSSAFFTSAMKLVSKALIDSLTLIYENDFNLAEAKKLNFRDEYVDLEYDNSYFEIFKKPNLNSLKEKLIKDEIEVKRSTPEVKDLSDLELDNLNVEIVDFDAFVRSLEE